MRVKFDLATSEGRAHALLDMTRRRARIADETEERALTWTLPVPDVRRILWIPVAVTGGVATRLYMPERLTDDLDLLISTNDHDVAYQAMLSAKAEYQGPHSAGGSRWLLPTGFPLDLPAATTSWQELAEITADPSHDAAGSARVDLLAINAPWVRAALQHAVKGPTGLSVLQLPYLALMKITTATLGDIADLSRLVASIDAMQVRRIEEMVVQFAPARLALLEDVLRTIESHTRYRPPIVK